MANENPFNDPEFDIGMWQQRAPRAGFWLGLLPTHPDIEALRMPHAQAAGGAGYVPPPAYPAPAMPPPYPVQHIPAPPVQPLVAPNNAVDISHISLSIPLNTNVVGGIVTQTPLRLPVNLSFEDFFSRVCARMDLAPLEAQLGYKFTGDRKADPPFRLATEDELRGAMAKGIDKMRRARSREVVMEVFNLHPAKQSAAARAGGVKRGAPGALNANNSVGTASEPETTISFVSELRELKRKLECSRHTGKHCYVNPVSGEHEFQDVYKLTSWAKSILFGEATYSMPPSMKDFDHVAKRRRRPNDRDPHPSTPAIHVHLPGSDTPTPLRTPLADRTANRKAARVIDLTDTDDDDALVAYPSIGQALQDLHTVMPVLDFPQYESILISKGIAYVNSVTTVARTFFVDVIHMPEGAVSDFMKHCAALMRRAQKESAGALVVKKEEKEN